MNRNIKSSLSYPQAWKSYKLKDLANGTSSSFTDGDWIESPYITDNGIRLVQTGNIGDGHFKNKNKKFISDESFRLLKCKEIFVGDILICRLADPIGRTCILPDLKSRAITSVDITIFRPDSKKVIDKFIVQLLNFYQVRKRLTELSGGSTRQRISRSNLGNLELVIPSRKEQFFIANILGALDEKVLVIETLLEQTNFLKKGLMQQLLTKGIGHTKFKSSHLGEIPESWEVSNIGELATLNPGKIVMDNSDDVSFIGMTDVSEDAKLISDHRRKYNEVSKGFTCFKDDDVILAKITPCFENGKGALIEGLINGVGFGSTEFHVIRVGDNALKEFIYYHTISTEFRLKGERNMTGSAGQRRVPRQFVENYPIGLPPLHEQRKIVEILGTVDKKLAILNEKKGKTELLKRGLMQQLLTGKIRVKVDEEVPIS
ncbi:restriction endonuclease subunit S [Chitinophaga sp. HK235]|uniref:restriction endonuclease subunit S n=1 Tax=Chitinophaga sp. HK235 TaxID=2952571 RepID=UPI001BA9D7AA|nr:restriction endonuclease subunit S [Chitinophaga sp. HK235]